MRKSSKLEKKNKNINIEFGNEIAEIPYGKNFYICTNNNKSKKKKSLICKRKYQLQFFLSSFIAIIFIFSLVKKLFSNYQQEKLSKALLNNYRLTSLYSNTKQYETDKSNYNTATNNPFVIGMIKIEKLQLSYAILSEANDDLLKISLCRFAGPMPNQIGNLCIAGHNYIDNSFFSRLDELQTGDSIELYDLTGTKQEYHIFKKYETEYDNLYCTSQNVGNKKIITLLTCDNSNNKKRIVVQAK